MSGRLKRSETGRIAEQAAADRLVDLGYEILDRNFLVPRVGELDLIAARDGNLTVIEVKARSQSDAFGGLEAAISPGKYRRMRKTTLYYLKKNQLMNNDVTFLAALVKIDRFGKIDNLSIVPIEWH